MAAAQNARISLSVLLSWRKDVIDNVKVEHKDYAVSLRKRVRLSGTGRSMGSSSSGRPSCMGSDGSGLGSKTARCSPKNARSARASGCAPLLCTIWCLLDWGSRDSACMGLRRYCAGVSEPQGGPQELPSQPAQ